MAVAALTVLVPRTGWSASQTNGWDAVVNLAEKIKVELAVRPRTQQAKDLAALVRERAGKVAPKIVVRTLAGMMTDRNDSVRYWIATALGYLGPQAAEAIPALEKARKDMEGHPADKTSESAIRLALNRIGRASK